MYLGITFYAVPKFMMLTDRNVTSSLCPVFFGYFIDFHHIIFSFLFFSRLISVSPANYKQRDDLVTNVGTVVFEMFPQLDLEIASLDRQSFLTYSHRYVVPF